MRISTLTMFNLSQRALTSQQARLMHVGQQIASGRRVLNPSDDPQAASKAVQVSQAQAITSQYTDTRVSARNSLSMEESVLGSVADAIGSAKTLILEAANGTLSDADRASAASQLEGIFHTVMGQANATDGNGRYLFGGYQDSTQPYITNVAGQVQFVGDTHTRHERIDAARLMEVQDSGDAIFNGAQGTTGFMAIADTGNTGAVIVKGPEVVDRTDPNFGTTFNIEFTAAPGGSTYTITDTGGNVLQAAQPYESGQAIEYAGLAITPSGAAATGDAIHVDQSQNLNTNLFRTFEKALAILKAPVNGDPSKQAALQNTLGNVMTEFDNSLDNVLMVRASVGSRLNELSVIDKVSGNRQINYAQTKSDLVDLDYTTAVSEYSIRMIGLKAAQQAFSQMKQMTLFSKI